MDSVHKIVPIWTCHHGELYESNTLQILKEFVKANGRISGIFIDVKAPREMGQILRHIFSNRNNCRDLLAEEYTVLAITRNRLNNGANNCWSDSERTLPNTIQISGQRLSSTTAPEAAWSLESSRRGGMAPSSFICLMLSP